MSPRRRYLALLRAVNVGGHSVVKQSVLREQFEAHGLVDVATYLQSGNLAFTSEDTDAEGLARRLEERLESALGLCTMVFLFSKEQLEEAAAHNPFEPERLDGEQHCHLMFFCREPEPARRDALMALQGGEYRFHIQGTVLYYAFPRAIAGHRKSIDFERVLGLSGTARTWKVVNKLIELADKL